MGEVDFFETISKKFLGQIEKAVQRALPQNSICGEMACYQLSTGGKRLRALLPLMIFEAMGRSPQDALPLGVAVELIHNATLVHDDLQDGDVIRRGQPTVWKKFSQAQAINSGDALFFFALQALDKLQVDASVKGSIFSYAFECTGKVIEGQAAELVMKTEKFPNLKRYTEIITGKTSALFCLPVVASLLALGENSDVVSEAEQSAIKFGQLFQIHDDYIDLFGEKKRDRQATDLAEGKVSFLVAYVNTFGTQSEKTELSEILKTTREKTTDKQIRRGLEIFEKSGAKNAAEIKMRDLKTEILAKKTAGHPDGGLMRAFTSLMRLS